MSRRHLLVLVAVFLVTRAILGWLAASPDVYRTSFATVASDVELYETWAFETVAQDRFPYYAFPVEYPPGSIPFVVIPELGEDDEAEFPNESYLGRFVAMMFVIDALGLAGLVLLSSRRGWGSPLGPWVWVVALFLLGPIIYARLDLIPAVATIWALERAAAGAWFGTGAWLGFGAAAKVYPALLLPLALAGAVRRRVVVAGAATVIVLVLLPYLGAIPDLVDSVFGFHSRRGVHVESTWGNLLLLASHAGYDAIVGLSYGAFHVESSLSGAVKALGALLAIAATSWGTWVSWKLVPRGNVPAMAMAMFGTLMLVQAAGTVFSPQFVIWLIALGAAAACAVSHDLPRPVMILLPVALATQLIYPAFYHLVIAGNLWATILVASRNLFVLTAGLGAITAARAWASTSEAAPAAS